MSQYRAPPGNPRTETSARVDPTSVPQANKRGSGRGRAARRRRRQVEARNRVENRLARDVRAAKEALDAIFDPKDPRSLQQRYEAYNAELARIPESRLTPRLEGFAFRRGGPGRGKPPPGALGKVTTGGGLT